MRNANGRQTLESMSQAVWYNQWTLKKFEPFLKGEILEVGCGIGSFTQTLAKYDSVWVIDINQNYLEKVRKKLGIKVKSGFGDIEKGEYFFGKKEFDCIISLNVLEHIKDDRKALKNIYSLLKSNGYLILLVPAHDFLYGKIDQSIGHFRRYNKKVLEEILTKIGFKIIKIKTLNFLGAIGWWISSKLLSNSRVDESKIRIFNFIAPFVLRIEDLVEPPFGTSMLIIAKK